MSQESQEKHIFTEKVAEEERIKIAQNVICMAAVCLLLSGEWKAVIF